MIAEDHLSIEERVSAAVVKLHAVAILLYASRKALDLYDDALQGVGEIIHDVYYSLKPIMRAPADLLGWSPADALDNKEGAR